MRWSKIKNIIIVLLVIVNVSLLALVGLRAAHSRRLERETRAQMIAVLAKNGVEYVPDAIPGDMDDSGAPITAVTALTRFLAALNQEGYVCSQITDMYAGVGEDGTTPFWYIETDAWPWQFAVDAYTGRVTVSNRP